MEQHTGSRWNRRREREFALGTEAAENTKGEPARQDSAPVRETSQLSETARIVPDVIAPTDVPTAPCRDMRTSVEPTSETPVGASKHKPREPCPICFEDFTSSDVESMPRSCRRCGNNFHQSCLRQWSLKEQQIKWEQKPWLLPSQMESGSCPICRSNSGHDKSRRWTKK